MNSFHNTANGTHVGKAKPRGIFDELKDNHARQMKVHGAEQFNLGATYGHDLAKKESFLERWSFFGYGFASCAGVVAVVYLIWLALK